MNPRQIARLITEDPNEFVGEYDGLEDDDEFGYGYIYCHCGAEFDNKEMRGWKSVEECVNCNTIWCEQCCHGTSYSSEYQPGFVVDEDRNILQCPECQHLPIYSEDNI
jgi:hypothetical protein